MEITEKEMKPVGSLSESPVATYDPAKKYRWSQEAKFYFNGGEFGVILNSLRQVLSTREAQTILLAERASQMIESALAKAVESGVAKEEKEEKRGN